MAKLLSLLAKPWAWGLLLLISIFGLLVLAGLLFGGALAQPLWLGVAALLLLLSYAFLLLVAWSLRLRRDLRRTRSDASADENEDDSETTRTAAAAEYRSEARAQQEQALQGGLQEALEVLRRQGGRRPSHYLYSLPWYVIIGPPGAGKTTALLNSGLSFPLAGNGVEGPVAGVGGTQNCDWWFTEEAVLLDTAGRYTTRDSDAEVDTAGWHGFLDVLAKARPRQPINGVLAAISLRELLEEGEAGRQRHARALRARLRELQDVLGIRFPVYLLITKADLLSGFMTFFDDLDREGRAQVWGVTLPLHPDAGRGSAGAAAPEATPSAEFGPAFQTLVEGVNRRVVKRLQEENDFARRAEIFAFPQQFASLQAPVEDLLGETFAASRFEPTLELRGVYFTSGTQEGAPIDRLLSALSGSFGIERAETPELKSSGRSYFLTRLLRDVVFQEAGLAGPSEREERRLSWRAAAALGASLVVAIGLAAFWFGSYRANSEMLRTAAGELQSYEESLESVEITPLRSADLARVLPSLDRLRALPAGYALRQARPPLAQRLGLSQWDELQSAGVSAYRQGLNDLLLPRLLLLGRERLEASEDAEARFADLKAYLMLGTLGPLDPTFLTAWVEQRALAGRPAVMQDLAPHLASLLEAPLQRYALDGESVTQARRVLSESSTAVRLYRQLLDSQAVRNLPAWRPVDHAGPAGSQVFRRASGASLAQGVPGAFTETGFHQTIRPLTRSLAEAAIRDFWVLGRQAPAGGAPAGGALSGQPEDAETLKRDILSLYLDDYVAQWDALLADLQLREPASLRQLAEQLNRLSGPRSPLSALLGGVAEQTTLVRPAAPGQQLAGQAAAAAGAVADAAANAAAGAAGDAATQAAAGTPPSLGLPSVATPPPQWSYVDERFEDLHRLVSGQDGAPPPLNGVLTQMQQAYRQTLRLSNSNALGAQLLDRAASPDGALGSALQTLSEDSAQLPAPLNGWVADLATAADGRAAAGIRAELNAAWKADVLPACKLIVERRYPFVVGSGDDAPLSDFARLFGPGGLIDALFQAKLQPLVDTRSDPWTWYDVGSASLGISESSLAVFSQAARIRDAFFGGPGMPAAAFDVTPSVLDASIEQVRISLGQQSLIYYHGPPETKRLVWPGDPPTAGAALAMQPPPRRGESRLAAPGEWGLFRLLERGQLRTSSSSDRVTVDWRVGGAAASFQVRSTRLQTPLNLELLRSFSCPDDL